MSDISTPEKLKAYLQRRIDDARADVARNLNDAVQYHAGQLGRVCITDARESAKLLLEWETLLRVAEGK